MLHESKLPYLSEVSGALTPDLEAAAHTSAHACRIKRTVESIQNRGDRPLAPTADSPSAPKRR